MGVTVRMRSEVPHLGYSVFVVHKGKWRSFLVGAKKDADAAAAKIRSRLALGQFDLGPPRRSHWHPH